MILHYPSLAQKIPYPITDLWNGSSPSFYYTEDTISISNSSLVAWLLTILIRHSRYHIQLQTCDMASHHPSLAHNIPYLICDMAPHYPSLVQKIPYPVPDLWHGSFLSSSDKEDTIFNSNHVTGPLIIFIWHGRYHIYIYPCNMTPNHPSLAQNIPVQPCDMAPHHLYLTN